MITADQILAHLIGDYLLQSHWMAQEKTKRSIAAAVHAVSYTLPFLFQPAALFFRLRGVDHGRIFVVDLAEVLAHLRVAEFLGEQQVRHDGPQM